MSLFKKKKNNTETVPEENEETKVSSENEEESSDDIDPALLPKEEIQPSSVNPSAETNAVPDEIERYNADIKEGLTSEQVTSRIEKELVNRENTKSGKTTWQIIYTNVFTYFNMLLLAIGIVLIVFGNYAQSFFLVIAFANTLIGIIQELKAKKAYYGGK